MSRYWAGLFFLVIFVLAGCRSGNLNGPPAAGSQEPEGTIPAQIPEAADIADLAANPADYGGRYLAVSGDFRPAPVIACETKTQRSPATWGLAKDEQIIAAAGPGSQYPHLNEDQPPLSVTGFWRLWNGPVGCGRQALSRVVWYLDVDRLLSPNPIALVPTGSISNTPSMFPEGSPSPQGTPTGDSGGLSLTPTMVSTATISPPSPPLAATAPAATVIVSPSPASAATATLGSGTATVTASATASSTASANPAATATATPTASATTATTPVPGATATATATVGAGGTPTIVDQEEITSGSLETGILAGNEIHRWPLVITATTAITVNLASELGLDVAFQVQDSAGNVLASKDGAADGQPEILADISLPAADTYQLLISSPDDGSGAYAVLLNDSESYVFIFQGTLGNGETGSASAQARNDHLWHFSGTAGDSITVVVTPNDNSNMFIRLFDPNASVVVDFHDETGAGEAETLIFTLPATGFYTLLIGEYNFAAANYQISLTLE